MLPVKSVLGRVDSVDLLVDIGNSRLKWGIDVNNCLALGEAISHHDKEFDARLFSVWRSLSKSPRRLAVSCVAGTHVFSRVRETALELWPSIDIRQCYSESEAHGVRNAYEQPEKLGVDRWLCLIAARHRWAESVCIVDCGTAITVDVMDECGRHLGGLICPGLTLMKESLLSGTAGLVFAAHNGSPHLARNTGSAINNGALYAVIGLIRTVIADFDKPFKLVLTGGDADQIAPYLECPSCVVPDLVLKGLSLILAE